MTSLGGINEMKLLGVGVGVDRLEQGLRIALAHLRLVLKGGQLAEVVAQDDDVEDLDRHGICQDVEHELVVGLGHALRLARIAPDMDSIVELERPPQLVRVAERSPSLVASGASCFEQPAKLPRQ